MDKITLKLEDYTSIEDADLAAARPHVAALVACGVTYWDEDIGCTCNGCLAVAPDCGELPHADDCPVAAARRWLAGDGD